MQRTISSLFAIFARIDVNLWDFFHKKKLFLHYIIYLLSRFPNALPCFMGKFTWKKESVWHPLLVTMGNEVVSSHPFFLSPLFPNNPAEPSLSSFQYFCGGGDPWDKCNVTYQNTIATYFFACLFCCSRRYPYVTTTTTIRMMILSWCYILQIQSEVEWSEVPKIG